MSKPIIYNAFGKPAASWNGGDYNGAWSDRIRKYMTPKVSRPESEMLRPKTRERLIAHIRSSVRNNLVIRAILQRYAISIGSPVMHSETDDPLYNDLKELFTERQFARIGYGAPMSLARMVFVLANEFIIGGEVFTVFTRTGKVQMIPSELCGSPENPPEREYQGIGYDGAGRPAYYRFGTRLDVKGHKKGSITFDLDKSTVVDAEFVHHIYQPDRVEENRGSPPLAPAIAAIQDLEDIVTSKVMQIKLQSAYAMFIRKNVDPNIYVEMIQNSSDGGGQLIEMATARGVYEDIEPGSILYGEIGEDVQQLSPNINAQDFSEFERNRLYYICSCIPIPPEEALLGYSESNYSSSRADKLRWKQAVYNHRSIFEDTFLNPLQAWQSVRGTSFNEMPPVPEGQINEVNWTWPPLPAIDPLAEAREDIMLKESGLETSSEIVGRRGRHIDTVNKQIVREAKQRAKLLLEAAGETRDPTLDEIRAEMPNAQVLAQALSTLNTTQQEEE